MAAEAGLPEAGASGISPRCFASGCLALLAIGAVFLREVCFTYVDNTDQGLIPLGAELIARGGLLYRDMHTVVWPGSYLILASVFKVFGASFAVGRAALYCELLLMTGLILHLSRIHIRTWLVFLPATIFIAAGAPPWNCNYYHWDALLFFLLSACCLRPALCRKKAGTVAPIFAGVFAGTATTCFQALGPGLLLALVAAGVIHYAVHADRRESISLTLKMAAGYGSVIVSLLAYMAATHNLTPFYECTLSFVLKDYKGVNTVPYGFCRFLAKAGAHSAMPSASPLVSLVETAVRTLVWQPYAFIKYSPLVVAAGTIAAMVRLRDLRPAVLAQPVLCAFIIMGFAFWLAELHRPDINRLFWGSQLLVIGALFFAERMIESSPWCRVPASLFCVLLALGTLVSLGLQYAHFSGKALSYETRRGRVRSLANLDVIPALEALTRPGETVLVYPYETAINYLSDTRFPARFPLLHYNFNSKKDFEHAISEMRRTPVRFAVWDSRWSNESFADLGYPSYKELPQSELIMESFLRSEYETVNTYGRFRLLKRRRAGLPGNVAGSDGERSGTTGTDSAASP